MTAGKRGGVYESMMAWVKGMGRCCVFLYEVRVWA